MDIYLMRNGTRHGPLRIFQVKEMLDRGEAAAGDLGWHPGLGEWQPLSEIEALTPYLPRLTPPPLPPPTEVEVNAWAGVDQPPGVARPLTGWELLVTRALPRFLARLFDALLWFSVICGLGIATGRMQPGEFAFPPIWFLSGHGLLWVLVEAWLLSRFGFTPGKWIFNLSVERLDGDRADYLRVLKRAFFIWVCAWGLNLPLWTLFGSFVALILYLKNGRMVWDFLVRTQVVHGPARPVRWFLFGAMISLYTAVKMIVMLTQPLPESMDPEARKQLEETREMMRSSFRNPNTRRV
jgi:uncharacterized RDD family membrane protein YckC